MNITATVKINHFTIEFLCAVFSVHYTCYMQLENLECRNNVIAALTPFSMHSSIHCFRKKLQAACI